MNSYGGVQGLIFREILCSTHIQHWICAARTKWSKNCAARESAPRCAQNREWLPLPLDLHSELRRGETHVFLFLGHRARLRRKQRYAELEGIKTSTEQKTKLKNSSISKSYDRREFSTVFLNKIDSITHHQAKNVGNENFNTYRWPPFVLLYPATTTLPKSDAQPKIS